MSAMDIFEDGFPHSTREGYRQGCRGGACPAAVDGLLTCSQANTRYQGDYGYRKLVDAGKTPQEIAAIDAEQLQAAHAKSKTPPATKSKTTTDHYPEPTVTVASSAEPIDKPAPSPTTLVEQIARVQKRVKDISEETAPVVAGAPTGDDIPLEKHGTTRGYSAGCRRNDCPGIPITGMSCRQAVAKYQAELKAKKRSTAQQRVDDARATFPSAGETNAATPRSDAGEPEADRDPASVPGHSADTAAEAPAEAHASHEDIIRDELTRNSGTDALTPDPDTPRVPVDTEGLLADLAGAKAENARLQEQIVFLTLELDVARSQINRNIRNGTDRVTLDVDRHNNGEVSVHLRIVS